MRRILSLRLFAALLLTAFVVTASPGTAVAQDADAGVTTAAGDAGAHVPSIRKKKPKTIDFEGDDDGPSAGEEMTSRNPKAVKYKSLMPEKYKRPTGAKTENKRGRGCAGCAGGTDQTGAAALFLLMIAFAVRRMR